MTCSTQRTERSRPSITNNHGHLFNEQETEWCTALARAEEPPPEASTTARKQQRCARSLPRHMLSCAVCAVKSPQRRHSVRDRLSRVRQQKG